MAANHTRDRETNALRRGLARIDVWYLRLYYLPQVRSTIQAVMPRRNRQSLNAPNAFLPYSDLILQSGKRDQSWWTAPPVSQVKHHRRCLRLRAPICSSLPVSNWPQIGSPLTPMQQTRNETSCRVPQLWYIKVPWMAACAKRLAMLSSCHRLQGREWDISTTKAGQDALSVVPS